MRLQKESTPRFFRPPKQSFFLLGPRGTGKSTWLRQELPDALVVDLLDPATHREMTARPERLRQLVLGAPRQRTVVIDEVQRVPELLGVVHSLLESERPRRRFVLTGSSARRLRRGGVNLLGGRALLRSFHPFMAGEWPGFRLDRALTHGLVPLVVTAPDPGDVLRAYAALYLEQEVKAEGWARDIGGFARFLEAATFSHAAPLNVANTARECQVERKTVAAWFEVLEDLLLAFRVPVFTKRARRATAAHDKLYWFDAGVFRTLRPKGPLDRPGEIDGDALEGLVAEHLRTWIAWSGRDAALHYWRTRSGVEVDLVVYGAKDFLAIEVKNTATVRSRDLAALRTFASDYPECRPFFLYRGSDTLRVDGIDCRPVDEFLRSVDPARPLVAPRSEPPPRRRRR